MVLPHFKHHFQALAELELADMGAPNRMVYRIWNSLSSSLRRLTFRKMALCVNEKDNELDNDAEKPNAWSALFLDMKSSLTLEQLSLSNLEHHTPKCSSQNGHPVAFLPSNFGVQSGPNNGLLYAWSHQGSFDAIREFLQELHSKTIIICRKCKKENAGYRSVEDMLML
jgi:hypothetical protein